jgi:hypothetical protein
MMLTTKQCTLLEGAKVNKDFGQNGNQFYMNRGLFEKIGDFMNVYRGSEAQIM